MSNSPHNKFRNSGPRDWYQRDDSHHHYSDKRSRDNFVSHRVYSSRGRGSAWRAPHFRNQLLRGKPWRRYTSRSPPPPARRRSDREQHNHRTNRDRSNSRQKRHHSNSHHENNNKGISDIKDLLKSMPNQMHMPEGLSREEFERQYTNNQKIMGNMNEKEKAMILMYYQQMYAAYFASVALKKGGSTSGGVTSSGQIDPLSNLLQNKQLSQLLGGLGGDGKGTMNNNKRLFTNTSNPRNSGSGNNNNNTSGKRSRDSPPLSHSASATRVRRPRNISSSNHARHKEQHESRHHEHKERKYLYRDRSHHRQSSRGDESRPSFYDNKRFGQKPFKKALYDFGNIHKSRGSRIGVQRGDDDDDNDDANNNMDDSSNSAVHQNNTTNRIASTVHLAHRKKVSDNAIHYSSSQRSLSSSRRGKSDKNILKTSGGEDSLRRRGPVTPPSSLGSND